MKSLMIKDLALDKELNGKTMAAVRGGFNNGNIFKGDSSWMTPYSFGYDPSSYSPSPSVTNTATQSNSIVQGGNVQVGNGALTSGGISVVNTPFALGLNLNGSTVA
jgi:hypothetical protein